jgi:hypothetical protein
LKLIIEGNTMTENEKKDKKEPKIKLVKNINPIQAPIETQA